MKVRSLICCSGVLLGASACCSTPVWRTEIPSQRRGIEGFAVANDGSVLVSAGYRPGHVILLDGRSGRALWTRRTHGDFAWLPGLSADGSRALYKDVAEVPSKPDVTRDTLYLLDRRGRMLLTRRTQGGVALSPRGDRIAVWDQLGDPRWGMKMLDLRGRTLWQDPRTVERLDFTGDALHLLTAGSGSRLWSARGKCVWKFGSAWPPVASKNGRTLAAVGERRTGEQFLRIVHRPGPGARERQVRAVRAAHHQSRWEAVGVSADGSLVVGAQPIWVGKPYGLLSTYYLLKAYSPSGKSRWTAMIPPIGSGVDFVNIQALGEDGFVAVFSGDGILRCFAVSRQGEVRRFLTVQNKRVTGIHSWRLSPNGRKLAVTLGNEIRLYSLPAT